jgi:uncharacterized repeat protein (TIGR03803 family)
MIEKLRVRELNGCKTACGLVLLCAAMAVASPAQTFTTLVNFNRTNGSTPVGALVQGTDGNLYGTTRDGGAYNNGTVFKVTPTGALKTIYSFCAEVNCPDGHKPFAGLVLATDGNFYGTTTLGGANPFFGTVFKITSSGAVTLLHSFTFSDGAQPYSGLVQATDGNFYGTTWVGGGGTYGWAGTVFKITPGGTLTTLYAFCSEGFCADGSMPSAALVQGTDGNFYGTTQAGGTNTCGTVFSISVGLGPFVKTIPTSGSAGTQVFILGNGLIGASSVTFNDIPATFTVVSQTEITATVPNGATTAKVKVTTPGGLRTSNVAFSVTN